jgi:hypothetical protein
MGEGGGDSRYFGNKKRGYLKGNINDLETNNKNKNVSALCLGTNVFQKEMPA